MTIENIQKIISTDETRTLELKKTTGELKDGMHSACAFLNTDGGWLIFGVAPTSLKIIGQQVTDMTRQDIGRAIAGLEPRLDMDVKYIDIPDKPGFQVIAMHFDGWSWGMEPYTYRGCPYIRSESTTQIMPREMFNERLRAAHPIEFAWENQASYNLTESDLDENRIYGSIRAGVQGGRMPETALSLKVPELLYNLGLVENGKILNGAAMLYIKDARNFPQFRIRMARFKGTDKLEFIDNKVVTGNFFDILDAGIQFCFKHLNLGGKIVGFKREEQLEIPREAIREGLINAECHRRYDQPGTSIGLAIYDDRLEIENPGRLPVELDAESIKKSHKSHPYNQKIADVLYKADYIESWGTGVPRMVDICKAAGLPEPYYELTDGFVTLVFKKKSDGGNGVNRGADGANCGAISLTERQTTVYELFTSDSKYTTKELSQITGISMRTLQRELSVLETAGYISRDIKRRGGYWELNTK